MIIFSKKNLKLITVFATITLIYLFVFSLKREITFIGFAYRNDVVRIKESNITLKTIVVDGNENEKHICSFYEKFSYYEFGSKVNLTIEVDSAGHKLLDTVLVLSDKNIKPTISFEDPTETKFRRQFFVIDKTDKLLII